MNGSNLAKVVAFYEVFQEITVTHGLPATIRPAPATATDAFAGRLKTHGCVSFLGQLFRAGNLSAFSERDVGAFWLAGSPSNPTNFGTAGFIWQTAARSTYDIARVRVNEATGPNWPRRSTGDRPVAAVRLRRATTRGREDISEHRVIIRSVS